jgi:hypothetical protein
LPGASLLPTQDTFLPAATAGAGLSTPADGVAAAASPCCAAAGGGGGGGGGGSATPTAGAGWGLPGEELRCVLAVVRHGDRTPKQKVKVVVHHVSTARAYGYDLTSSVASLRHGTHI